MPDRDTVVNDIKNIIRKTGINQLEHVSTVVDGMSTIPRLAIDATKHNFVIVWYNMTGAALDVAPPFGKVVIHQGHAYLFVDKGKVPPRTYPYKLTWEEKAGVWKACEGRHSDPEIIVR